MVRKRTSGVTKKHKLKNHNKPTRKHKKTHNKQVRKRRKRRTGKRRRKRGGSKITNDKLNYDKLNYDKLKKDAIQFMQTDAKISSIIGKDLQKVIIPYIENASEKQMNEIMKDVKKKLKGLQSGKKQYGGLDGEDNHLCVLNDPSCNGEPDTITLEVCSNSECLRFGPSQCYRPNALKDWFDTREGRALPATIPHLGNDFSVREMQNGLPQWCVPYDTYIQDRDRYNELAATAALEQQHTATAAADAALDVAALELLIRRRRVHPQPPLDPLMRRNMNQANQELQQELQHELQPERVLLATFILCVITILLGQVY